MDGTIRVDPGSGSADHSLYPIELGTQVLCGYLKLPPQRALDRAGLDPSLHLEEDARVTARDFHALWDAMMDEAAPELETRTALLLDLASMFARGPFVPAILAYACSPTVAIGATRMERYKPLIAPTTMLLRRGEDGLLACHGDEHPSAPMPDSLSAFHALIFVEMARAFTTEQVTPLCVGLPAIYAEQPSMQAYFGVEPRVSHLSYILLSHEDADRRLLSENAALWASLETDLETQLAGRERAAPIEARVRGALIELLPRGHATAEAVAARLRLGKRSLQRRLAEIGRSFQSVLDATRTDLALHYLRHSDRTIEEISYLLAYRDPNSFYRAFQGWTGMTPMQARRGEVANSF